MRGERGARGGARPRGKEQREGRHVPRGPRPAALPRISIEKTPANDLHLLLNQVLPTADIVQFLKRPEAFFQKHRPELQFAKQLLENQLKELSTRLRVELAPQARPPPGCEGAAHGVRGGQARCNQPREKAHITASMRPPVPEA